MVEVFVFFVDRVMLLQCFVVVSFSMREIMNLIKERQLRQQSIGTVDIEHRGGEVFPVEGQALFCGRKFCFLLTREMSPYIGTDTPSFTVMLMMFWSEIDTIKE